jgi:hypothetical protein
MLYYLVDALPALLGSMATLWAVCSPRHWFVRSCFIAALLLLFLLIPAYELVVAGCTQIAVIMGGITLWRKRRYSLATAERWRVSLRNLLLFTVLAAVAMAVLASFPDSPRIYWARWTLPGIGVGCVTLFALWLATSKKRRLVRWPAALGFILITALVDTCVQVLSWATRDWTNFSSQIIPYLYAPDTLRWAGQLVLHYLPVNAIRLGLISLWIYLFIRTGWFDPFCDVKLNTVPLTKRLNALVRVTWVLLTVAIAVLPVTLLVKLALPMEQIKKDDYRPEYFEHLVAAGEMISEADSMILIRGHRLKTADLAKEIAKHADAFDHMKRAFRYLQPTRPANIDTDGAFRNLVGLVAAREEYADRVKDADLAFEATLDSLVIVTLYVSQREGAQYAAVMSSGEQARSEQLWASRSQLTTEQLSHALRVLQFVESDRATWQQLLENQRIVDVNAGWESHLQVMLDDWLGVERYLKERDEYFAIRTKIRLMLLDLALLSYQDANGRLPDSLEELAPRILKELPTDPYGDGPLRYRRTDNGYTLYSVGPNKIDESGKGDDKTLDALMRQAVP